MREVMHTRVMLSGANKVMHTRVMLSGMNEVSEVETSAQTHIRFERSFDYAQDDKTALYRSFDYAQDDKTALKDPSKKNLFLALRMTGACLPG